MSEYVYEKKGFYRCSSFTMYIRLAAKAAEMHNGMVVMWEVSSMVSYSRVCRRSHGKVYTGNAYVKDMGRLCLNKAAGRQPCEDVKMDCLTL